MTRTATFKEHRGFAVFVLVVVTDSLDTLNIFILNLFRPNISYTDICFFKVSFDTKSLSQAELEVPKQNWKKTSNNTTRKGIKNLS